MLRHFNRKKKELAEVDPKHVAFWEKLFSMPFVTLLGCDATDGMRLMFEKEHETGVKHNTCILHKVEAGLVGEPGDNRRWISKVPRLGDMVTAFYFPLIPGLFEVQLEVGGQQVGRWTPEGSEFREASLPLPLILEECRGLPGLHVDWERILTLCREQSVGGSRIDHDFGRDLELEGVKYRRAVLVHPCLAMVSLAYHEVSLIFIFQEGSQEFEFYEEYWMLGHDKRLFVAQNQFNMSSQSDAFEDDSNVQVVSSGMMGGRFVSHKTISTLGKLLQDGVATARAGSNLGALAISGVSSQLIN